MDFGPGVTWAVAVALLLLAARAIRNLLRRPSPADRLRAPEGYREVAFPVSADDPGGLPPGAGAWPRFEDPGILGGVVPTVPECGVTYPLIYHELSEYGGSCEDDVASVVDWRKPALLRKARDQAKRYCIRQSSEDCQGVTEIDHSFAHACFRVGETTYLDLVVVYLFRCSDPGPPVVYGPDNPPPPSVPEPPPPPFDFPDCGGTYHFVAHDISEVAACDDPGIPQIEQQKADRLVDAARNHASLFCRDARDPICRMYSEHGHHVSHHCFRPGPANATYLASTIVYFFGCPPTV